MLSRVSPSRLVLKRISAATGSMAGLCIVLKNKPRRSLEGMDFRESISACICPDLVN